MINESNKILFWRVRLTGQTCFTNISFGKLEEWLLLLPKGKLEDIQEIEIGELK